MVSNHILQTTLENIKKVSNHDLFLLDTDGNLQLSTTRKGIRVNKTEIQNFAAAQTEITTLDKYIYFKIFEMSNLVYILAIADDSTDSFLVGKMAALQFQSLFAAYKERFDKDNFIKNLLLDNLLLVDIYQRAKRLHIPNEMRRIVLILETSPDRDQGSIENIRMMFADKPSDFVTAVDETGIIIVKGLEERDQYDTVRNIAESAERALPTARSLTN